MICMAPDLVPNLSLLIQPTANANIEANSCTKKTYHVQMEGEVF